MKTFRPTAPVRFDSAVSFCIGFSAIGGNSFSSSSFPVPVGTN